MLPNDADAIMDNDLATPHFTAWTARTEMNQLRDILRHLYPEDSEIVHKAELAFELTCWIQAELDKS